MVGDKNISGSIDENDSRILNSIYESIPLGIIIYDIHGKIISINQKGIELFGIKDMNDIIGVSLFDDPNIPEQYKNDLLNNNDAEYEVTYDFNLIKSSYYHTKNKGKKYFAIKASIIRDSFNKKIGYLEVYNDISPRIKHEKLLELAIAKLNSIFDTVASGIEIYDINGKLADCNNYDLQIFGLKSKEDFLSAGVTLFNNPNFTIEQKEKLYNGENITISTSYDFTKVKQNNYYPTYKDGVIQLEVMISPIKIGSDELIGFAVVMNDITRHKQNEQRLIEIQNNLRLALDAGKIAVWKYEKSDHQFISLVGDDNDRIIHPDDGPKLRTIINNLLDGTLTKGSLIARFKATEEEEDYRYYEGEMIGVTDINGNIIAVHGTKKDITEEYTTRLQKERFQKMMEFAVKSSDLVIWEYNINKDLFYTYHEEFKGYKIGEGTPPFIFQDAIHPDDKAEERAFFSSMCNRTNPGREIDVRLAVEGDTDWQHFTIAGIPFSYNSNGELESYVGYRKNNSKWIKLQNELKTKNDELTRLADNLYERNTQLNMALKAGNIIPLVWDIKKEMFYTTSPEMKDSYDGFDKDKNGLTIEQLLNSLHPDDRDKAKRLYKELKSGEKMVASDEFRFDSNNRYENIFECKFIRADNSKYAPCKIFGYMQNVTDRKQLLHELQCAKEKAEQSDKLKSSFLANMSHEIRTPLNSIVGFSELIASSDDNTAEEKAEYMRVIGINSNFLLHIVNDILDLSKIESGVMDSSPEKTNFSQLACDLLSIMQTKVDTTKIEFLSDFSENDLWLIIDPNRMKQIWINYITNAIKHTTSGSITMGYKYSGRILTIFVADTGTGIPTDLHDRVFGRFQKLNETAQGTGLGLAICKAIAEAAGGNVGFNSREGKGSTFWAKIPCRKC